MSTIKKFLSNTQMGKVIANFLQKDNLLTNDAGQVVLSAEDESKLISQFGEGFVSTLKSKTFSSEDAASQELFDAAVAGAVEQAKKPLQAQVTSLQGAVATLSAAPEVEPQAEPATASAPAGRRGFKADMALSHNRMAANFLNTGDMSASTTIDVAAVTTELGTYLSQGNNLDLVETIYSAFTTSKHLNWKRAVTEYKAIISEATSSVVQQFKADWNPKGAAEFKPLTIKNYRHKVDYAIDPTDVGESWLFHLYDESKTPDQMPITRYIISKVLLPKIAEDIEMIMTGKASYVADSGKTENAMDGIETQLVDAKASLDKNINFFAEDVNLLTATNEKVLSVIDDFVASIAPLYRSKQMPVYLSDDVYRKYKRAYKDKWGAGSGTEKADFGDSRVDFSNCYLQVLDCLAGSPILFSTPKQNFIGLKHKNPPQLVTDIQKVGRLVNILMEFWYGVGFLLGEAVFAIVPSGYTPNESISSAREGLDGKWIVTAEDKPAGDASGGDSETL